MEGVIANVKFAANGIRATSSTFECRWTITTHHVVEV